MGLELLTIFQKLSSNPLQKTLQRPTRPNVPVILASDSSLGANLSNLKSAFQAKLIASLSKGLDVHKQRALESYGINIDIEVNPDLPLNVDYQFQFNEPSNKDYLGKLEISPYLAARLSNKLDPRLHDGLINPRWTTFGTSLYTQKGQSSLDAPYLLNTIFQQLNQFAQPITLDRAYKVIHDNPRDGLYLEALDEFNNDISLDHQTRELLDQCEALPAVAVGTVRFDDQDSSLNALEIYYKRIALFQAGEFGEAENIFVQLDLARTHCAQIYGEDTISKIDNFIGYDHDYKVVKDINTAKLASVRDYANRSTIGAYKCATGLFDKSIAQKVYKALLQMPFYKTMDTINRKEGVQLSTMITFDSDRRFVEAGQNLKIEAGNFTAWDEGESTKTIVLVLSPEACELINKVHSISPEVLNIFQEINNQMETLLAKAKHG